MYYLAMAAVLIAGCSSDGNERRQEYLDADYYKRLELPPDLTSSSDKNQLNTPRPTEEAIDRFKQDTANLGSGEVEGRVAIASKIEGVRLQVADGIFWLEVDENVDKLWPHLSTFWVHEGIKVVRNEPALGIIETEWATKLQIADEGIIGSILSFVGPDRRDKFRMRVESEAKGSKTKISISHSGLEKSVDGDDVNWRSRHTEEDLELEILNRLALYVGLNETQAKEMFATYHPYASRVDASQGDAGALFITGSMDTVWKRSLLALDRLNIDVQNTDINLRQIKVAIEKLKLANVDEERDELAEGSWLMRWFRGSSDDYTEDESRQFMLKLSHHDGVVRLDVLSPDGESTDSVLAEQFRSSLAKELQ